MIELNKMTTIKANLEVIMTKMNNQERKSHSINEGTVNGAEQNRIADQGQAQEGVY